MFSRYRHAARRARAWIVVPALAAAWGVAWPLRAAPALRETPLSPEEELATFQLADKRLVVELVAHEPQLDSPVAIAWDADGRMFAAEMIDYPTGPSAGRIRMLEDRDNDGRYERATVFAEGLSFPNGVLPYAGGLFVTAAPDLLYFRDADGDGRAEQRRVVFTGFGEGNQQLRANGLTWGLDNWIYGANGRSDGNVRRPQDTVEQAVSIRARDFRFRPDGSRFEATSGQSQFGQASDDWGNRFLSWNTIPIRQALFEQGFIDRNPRLSAFGVRDIADTADSGRVFPISPNPQTFNRERTDYFNALCGLSIYRGDALGHDFLGCAFMGESLTNLVHRRILSPKGATFVSRRGDYDREFLASSDPWFHPVYTTTGPDGALYVVDFYRRWVEHPAFVPESMRGKVEWRQGAGHGRIWKVSRRERSWPPKPQPRLSRASTVQLVKHLESPNAWYRDTAHRLLVERRDPQAVQLLGLMISGSKLPQAKLHALSVLESMSQLEDGTLLRALEDGNTHVRQHALRLAAPRLERSLQLRAAAVALVGFPDSVDRFHAVLALANVSGADKTAAYVKLADLEFRDPIIPMAIAGGLGRSAAEFLDQLLKTRADWHANPNAEQIRLLELVAATAASGDDSQGAACLALLAPGQSPGAAGDLAIAVGVSQGLADRGQSLGAMLQASPSPLERHRDRLASLVARAKDIALADDKPVAHRLVAVELLATLDPAFGGRLVPLLEPRQPHDLQSAAAAALAQSDSASARQMIGAWQSLTSSTRRALLAAALRSQAATAELVAALESEHILPREIDPATRDGLLAVRDTALRERIGKLFSSGPASADRRQVVAKFEPLLERHGDRERGALVFEKNCLTCHSLQGRGQRVGPDLSGIGARPKEMLLVDLFDPSRQVSPNYIAYTLLTHGGQILTGVIAAETATSVTLRRAEGAEDVVLRSHIEELRSTGKSLMPEGIEQSLSEDNVADLLEFLSSPDARLFTQSR